MHCAWKIGEHTYKLSADDLVLIKPLTANDWLVKPPGSSSNDIAGDTLPDDGMELIWTIFNLRTHWLFWLTELDFRDGGLVIRDDTIDRKGISSNLRQASIDLADTFKRGGLRRDEWTLAALERLLLTVATYSDQIQVGLDARIRDAVEYIHANFADPLTVSDIARIACLSPQRLTALFTGGVGEAPAQYVERVRLGHAAQMLRFGLSNIEAIAKASGYADVPNFYRRFKIQFKLTPREYRNRCREVAMSAEK